jgi:hypothetical protein
VKGEQRDFGGVARRQGKPAKQTSKNEPDKSQAAFSDFVTHLWMEYRNAAVQGLLKANLVTPGEWLANAYTSSARFTRSGAKSDDGNKQNPPIIALSTFLPSKPILLI